MRNLLLAAVLLMSGAAHAALLSTTVTATGTYSNPLGLVNDGFIPPETTPWTSGTNVFWSDGGNNTVRFVFDLGADFLVRDILVSVDNNDTYRAQYSTDASNWTDLFIIPSAGGEISPIQGGMDTLTSEAASLEYLPAMEFAGQIARYISFEAIGGDSSYALAELQIFGDELPVDRPVPAPGTALLLAAGLAAMRLSRQRRGR